MMRTFLIILFGAILLLMILVTTVASLDRNILVLFQQPTELTSDPWFHATLADAYFGFITFYVWVAYKEPTIARKVIWFLLVMLLGNIAMSIYVLILLIQMKPGESLKDLLVSRDPPRVNLQQ